MRAPPGPPAVGVASLSPPAGGPAALFAGAQAPVTRPANNSLALPQPPDITCGQRGKGGGPTACIAVGLVGWLSASRRPAGAPAAVSAPGGAITGRRWPALWA